MLIVELLGEVSVVVVADTERERFGLSGVLELELGGSKFFSLISSKNSESRICCAQDCATSCSAS